MERKKKLLDPGTKYQRYSGPLRSNYRSPKTAVALRKSAFLPLPKSSPFSRYDLLSQHMCTHYRRIAEAESRTDTSIPVSLLKCTKVLDQAKNCTRTRCLRSTSSTQKSVSQSSMWGTSSTDGTSSWPQSTVLALSSFSKPGPESDAGFVSMSQSLESLHLLEDDSQSNVPTVGGAQSNVPMVGGARPNVPTVGGAQSNIPMVGEDSVNTAHKDSIRNTLCPTVNVTTPTRVRDVASPRQDYRYLLDSESSGRWQLYHTRTGRLTGYVQYQKNLSLSTDQHKTASVSPSPPWKPAFASNSNFLKYGSESSLQRQGSGVRNSIPASGSLRSREGVRQGSAPQTDSDPARHRGKEEGAGVRTALADDERERLETSNGLRETYTVGEPVAARSSCELQENIVDAQSPEFKLQESTMGTQYPAPCELGNGGYTGQLKENPMPLSDADNPITVAAIEAMSSRPSLGHSKPRADTVDLTAAESYTVVQRGRETTAAIASLTRQSLAVQRRSLEAKKRVDENSRECGYLEFTAGVTRDILTRGILSDSAMELLFEAHVERNRHQLREDIMRERLDSLKQQLTITT